MRRIILLGTVTVLTYAVFHYGYETAPIVFDEAYGGMVRGADARNISIEVEFRETAGITKRAKLLGKYQDVSRDSYTKQYIVVSDGLTGTIRVGEDVPYIEDYTVYLGRYGYVETATTAFKEIGTKLAVTPKIRGNYIEITLTPQVSYISDKDSGVIDIKEVSTSVLVADGQSVNIGGLFKDSEFSNIFFRTESASKLDIILTPHIQ